VTTYDQSVIACNRPATPSCNPSKCRGACHGSKSVSSMCQIPWI